MKNIFKYLLILPLWLSCTKEKPKTMLPLTMDKPSPETTIVPPEILDGIVSSIPDPAIVLSEIKNSGAVFNEEILNSAEHLSNYNTGYKKALNLGVYSADLSYTALYNRQNICSFFLIAICKLADDLKVGQFFKPEVLRKAKRLSYEHHKSDSLLFLIHSGIHDMTQYLNNNKRRQVSSLLLIGSWVESLYITATIAEYVNQPELVKKVGEQKYSFDNLCLLLSAYNQFPEFAPLIKNFEELKIPFDKVTISNTPIIQQVQSKKGLIISQENTPTQVIITRDIFMKILSVLKKIRQSMVS